MTMTEWAEREVAIACKRENPNRKEREWDYGCACYESALKAYKSLMEDGHSGASFSITRQILNRLMMDLPLTPIEDTDDIWNEGFVSKETGIRSQQCMRKSSLFKDIYPDGTVKYHDVDRFVCIDIHHPQSTYHSGLIDRICGEMYPIVMPYMPEDKHYKVYCEDFLVDKRNGDFDTVGILYVIEPDGTRTTINRFFKPGEEGKGWAEIDMSEYITRKDEAINL